MKRKKVIKLTENDLNRIVKRVINEAYEGGPATTSAPVQGLLESLNVKICSTHTVEPESTLLVQQNVICFALVAHARGQHGRKDLAHHREQGDTAVAERISLVNIFAA